LEIYVTIQRGVPTMRKISVRATAVLAAVWLALGFSAGAAQAQPADAVDIDNVDVALPP
jgi:hypothetical protein